MVSRGQGVSREVGSRVRYANSLCYVELTWGSVSSKCFSKWREKLLKLANINLWQRPPACWVIPQRHPFRRSSKSSGNYWYPTSRVVLTKIGSTISENRLSRNFKQLRFLTSYSKPWYQWKVLHQNQNEIYTLNILQNRKVESSSELTTYI